MIRVKITEPEEMAILDEIDHRNRYLLGLVRRDLRSKAKFRLALQRKHGDAFDPTELAAAIAFRRKVYRALGGDPDQLETDP